MNFHVANFFFSQYFFPFALILQQTFKLFFVLMLLIPIKILVSLFWYNEIFIQNCLCLKFAP